MSSVMPEEPRSVWGFRSHYEEPGMVIVVAWTNGMAVCVRATNKGRGWERVAGTQPFLAKLSELVVLPA